MGAPREIIALANRFREQCERDCLSSRGATEFRREFIDPFFQALGWDLDNRQGPAAADQDVVQEDWHKLGVSTKAPEYSFRVDGVRKFFVAARRPADDVGHDMGPAFQLRRYGWSAKLPLSILTDFEEFAVYDCRVRPEKHDQASAARLLYLSYEQYDDRWDEIASLFSLDAIRTGAFDKYVESTKKKRGTTDVGDAFLEEIERWRSDLARNLAARNSELSQREINFAVPKTIDRIIFLRVCEDRGIEIDGGLQSLTSGPTIYPRLCELFRKAGDRFNSGLFHFTHDKLRNEDPDEWTLSLQIDDRVLKEIIRSLYYPESPYEFSVLASDLLGQVYERFLGKEIRLTEGQQTQIVDKPEVKKAGGVYYTPAYIVENIVEQTVGMLLDDKTPHEVAARTKTAWQPSKVRRPLTVLDPACGSGTFLLGAYQYLLDWYRDWYVGHDPAKYKQRIYRTRRRHWRLTTAERTRILRDHIYGVDIDAQAVEVTKLSLLLKVLEGESQESLQRQLRLFREHPLPDLSDNIKCGNSLIGPDFFQQEQLGLFDEEERWRINSFDWHAAFNEILKSGGFDAVIGNPPYIRVGNVDEQLRPYLYRTYDINHRFDMYVVFIQRVCELLAGTGRLGFIVPNKFFTAEYGASLRAFLTENRTIFRIVDFGDSQVFAEATVYTCLLFLTREPCERIQYTAATTTRSADALQVSRTFHVGTSRLATAPWAFVDDSAASLLDRLQILKPLSEFCEFQRGLETGFDAVFLLTKHDDAASRSTVLVTSDVAPSPFELERSAIRRVVKGAVDVRRYGIEENDRYVLFPYEITDGRAVLVNEHVFRSTRPLAWAYLTRHANDLRARKKPGAWYAYRRRNYDLRDRVARLLVPSIARRAAFAADLSGEYHFIGSGGGGGGGYGLSLRPGVELSFHYILGLLNSNLLDWIVKLSNSRFGHGYYSFNRQYIAPLPIREIDVTDQRDNARHDEVVVLVERMLTLRKQSIVAGTTHEQPALARQIEATDREIDRLVYELYGLTDEEITIVEAAK